MVLILGGQSARDEEILAVRYLNSWIFKVRLYKNKCLHSVLAVPYRPDLVSHHQFLVAVVVDRYTEVLSKQCSGVFVVATQIQSICCRTLLQYLNLSGG